MRKILWSIIVIVSMLKLGQAQEITLNLFQTVSKEKLINAEDTLFLRVNYDKKEPKNYVILLIKEGKIEGIQHYFSNFSLVSYEFHKSRFLNILRSSFVNFDQNPEDVILSQFACDSSGKAKRTVFPSFVYGIETLHYEFHRVRINKKFHCNRYGNIICKEFDSLTGESRLQDGAQIGLRKNGKIRLLYFSDNGNLVSITMKFRRNGKVRLIY